MPVRLTFRSAARTLSLATLALFATLSCTATLPAQTGDSMAPAPAKPLLSPAQHAQVNFAPGPGAIDISYNSPSIRGRKIMGGLVPYGQVWRTGANPATTLVTTTPIHIGTLALPAGTYTLYTLPSEQGWLLIVNKQIGQWGTEYHQDQDLGRVPMQAVPMSSPQQVMSITFEHTTPTATQLHVRWETTDRYVPITSTSRTSSRAASKRPMPEPARVANIGLLLAHSLECVLEAKQGRERNSARLNAIPYAIGVVVIVAVEVRHQENPGGQDKASALSKSAIATTPGSWAPDRSDPIIQGLDAGLNQGFPGQGKDRPDTDSPRRAIITPCSKTYSTQTAEAWPGSRAPQQLGPASIMLLNEASTFVAATQSWAKINPAKINHHGLYPSLLQHVMLHSIDTRQYRSRLRCVASSSCRVALWRLHSEHPAGTPVVR